MRININSVRVGYLRGCRGNETRGYDAVDTKLTGSNCLESQNKRDCRIAGIGISRKSVATQNIRTGGVIGIEGFYDKENGLKGERQKRN